MKSIIVLTDACKSCSEMYDTVKQCVSELMLDATVTRSDNLIEIMKYNVIATPALIIDGKVRSVGKKLNKKQVTALLLKEN